MFHWKFLFQKPEILSSWVFEAILELKPVLSNFSWAAVLFIYGGLIPWFFKCKVEILLWFHSLDIQLRRKRHLSMYCNFVRIQKTFAYFVSLHYPVLFLDEFGIRITQSFWSSNPDEKFKLIVAVCPIIYSLFGRIPEHFGVGSCQFSTQSLPFL